MSLKNVSAQDNQPTPITAPYKKPSTILIETNVNASIMIKDTCTKPLLTHASVHLEPPMALDHKDGTNVSVIMKVRNGIQLRVLVHAQWVIFGTLLLSFANLTHFTLLLLLVVTQLALQAVLPEPSLPLEMLSPVLPL